MTDDRFERRTEPLPSPRPWESELRFGPPTDRDFDEFLEWLNRKPEQKQEPEEL